MRRTHAIRWASATVLAAAALSMSASAASAGDKLDDTIAEIRASVKRGDGKAVPLIAAIAEDTDPRVRSILHDLTDDRDPEIACAAYAAIGKARDKTFLVQMRTRAEDKKLQKNRTPVYAALLDAFLAVGDDSKATHELLDGLVQRFLPMSSEFSTRAIRAFSLVRDKDTVARLMVFLGQTDSVISTPGQLVPVAVNAETRENYAKAKVVVIECLTSLTGMQHKDTATWNAWWKENKATFKCPPLPAPAPVAPKK